MKRFIKAYILENWNLKATALLLALILWLFARGESGTERVVTIPLEVQVPSQMEIVGERLTTIEVTMRSPALSAQWFDVPLPTCVVDLQKAQEGEHIVILTPDNVRIPKGSRIEILQVNPTRVVLELERTVSKEIPIIVPLQGKLPEGLELYGKSQNPTSLTVTGPRSLIESLKEVATDPIPLKEQAQSARFFVNLRLKNNAIRTSWINPIQIDLQIGPEQKNSQEEHE
ncbi:MAG: YbbR-like domain-containing protein [Acidobacteria bacterium]|nr:YbbR-like domain-containing protein [Acidobacteriota bacterium]